MNDTTEQDPRLVAIPDTHGHAKGEHKPYAEERPLPLTARMLFLWFYHACRRGYPRFLMVADHMNYLTFEDPAAVNLVRRALKLAGAGDLHGAAETANVEVGHAAVVSEGLRRGMRYSIGAEVDNDPRSRPDAQNIVDAMKPDAIIRSVHFIPITHPVHGENWNWPFDNPEFADLFDVVGTDALWDGYINILVDAIERLPGHIIGHLYVPAMFGHWPEPAKLSAYEDRVLDAAAARGMAIEFNTRFLYRDHPDEEKDKYMTANRRLLRKAKERGVSIAIGSDAHSPRDQGNAFDIVLGVLDELEINELVFPLAGSLRRVALRVVREPEPEPPPPPPPPIPEPVAKPARTAAAAKKPAAAATNGVAAAPARKKVAKKTADTPAADPVAAVVDLVKAVLAPAKPTRAKTAAAAAAPTAADDAPVKAAPAKTPAPAKAAPPVKAAPPLKAAPPVKAVPPTKAAPSAKAAPITKPAPSSKAAPPVKTAASAAKPAPAKGAAKSVVAKPAAKTAAKLPAKTAAAKPAAKAASAKRAPVKTVAKTKPPATAAKKSVAPKKPVKKAPPVKAAAKKSAPAKKAAPAKKTGPSAGAKNVAPRGKPAPKKAPAKSNARPAAKKPAPKAATGKKSAKKPAPKRR